MIVEKCWQFEHLRFRHGSLSENRVFPNFFLFIGACRTQMASLDCIPHFKYFQTYIPKSCYSIQYIQYNSNSWWFNHTFAQFGCLNIYTHIIHNIIKDPTFTLLLELLFCAKDELLEQLDELDFGGAATRIRFRAGSSHQGPKKDKIVSNM